MIHDTCPEWSPDWEQVAQFAEIKPLPFLFGQGLSRDQILRMHCIPVILNVPTELTYCTLSHPLWSRQKASTTSNVS